MPGRNFRIARIAGIPVGISPWWLVVVALLTWSLSAGYFPQSAPDLAPAAYVALALASVLTLFAGILAHEFGACARGAPRRRRDRGDRSVAARRRRAHAQPAEAGRRRAAVRPGRTRRDRDPGPGLRGRGVGPAVLRAGRPARVRDLPGAGQRRDRLVQPPARVPPGRRPRRARAHLAADWRSASRDRHRGPRRSVDRLRADLPRSLRRARRRPGRALGRCGRSVPDRRSHRGAAPGRARGRPQRRERRRADVRPGRRACSRDADGRGARGDPPIRLRRVPGGRSRRAPPWVSCRARARPSRRRRRPPASSPTASPHCGSDRAIRPPTCSNARRSCGSAARSWSTRRTVRSASSRSPTWSAACAVSVRPARDHNRQERRDDEDHRRAHGGGGCPTWDRAGRIGAARRGGPTARASPRPPGEERRMPDVGPAPRPPTITLATLP